MPNPYDYVDPNRCCSARAAFEAYKHNEKIELNKQREQRRIVENSLAPVVDEVKQLAKRTYKGGTDKMYTFEEQLDELLERSKHIQAPDIFSDVQSPDSVEQADIWMGDVQIFYSNYLANHPLGDRMKSLLFHRNVGDYEKLISCLKSIRKDQRFIDKMNGVSTVSVPAYQAKTLPEYDVFISHANADKENLIEELNESLKKLGVKIFYDKDELEWGDNWKDRILNGTKKAEFAIIVISQNFFDREWTERELNEFLNRQNRNGQKLILPILHNITVQQLKEKYPSVADIQAIDSSKYTCDQIALLFARQLIKRLKSV